MIDLNITKKFKDVSTVIHLEKHPYIEQLSNKEISYYLPQVSEFNSVLGVVAKTNFFPQGEAFYGLYNSDLSPIVEGRLTRTLEGCEIRYKEMHKTGLDLLKKEACYVPGMSMYMGYLFPAFGHFMSESLSRFWPLLDVDISDLQFVFHSVRQDVNEGFLVSSGFLQYLEALGINREQILIINQPVLFEKLIVADQAIMFRDRGSFLQKKIWNVISSKANNAYKKKSDKIYLSRRNISNPTAARSLINEDEVEDVFKKHEFDIVYPHEFSDEMEKVSLISQASFIASASGSGLHNSAFSSSATVLQISSVHRSQGVPFQHLIDDLASNKLLNFFTNLKGKKDGEWYVDCKVLDEKLKSVV